MSKNITNKDIFFKGMLDGIPIGLGYLAVAFSLGIAAKNAGLSPLQSFFASFFCSASAGEYAGFVLIASGATYLELAVMTVIVNARYLLMSCSLSQKMDPDVRPIHRFLVAFGLTDEIFGIAAGRPGYLNPFYSYGAMFVAIPLWAIGTMLGTIAGNILPLRLVSALSVALYGMFLAIIIPPARKERLIGFLVAISFLFSYLFSVLPVVSKLSEGMRTIILTVLIAGGAALLFPRPAEESGDRNEQKGENEA